MYEDERTKKKSAWLLASGIVMLALGVFLLANELPATSSADSPGMTLVMPGCKQAQTITYKRCGHEVQRRIDVPMQWVGMTRETVTAAMDPAWRMTGFSGGEIEMVTALDIFCPAHWVLMLTGDGTPAVFRNKYGFSMEKMGDKPMGTLDEATRTQLAVGLPFDTEAALSSYVKEYGENR